MRAVSARGLFGGAALVLALAVAPDARAQSAAALQDAMNRFEEGLDAAAAAHRTGDPAKWEEARVKFQQAYAVVRRPSLVFNLAYSEENLDRRLEAIEHYREYLRFADRPKEADARARLERLLGQVGQLRIEAPAGAEIELDGVWLPQRAPLEDTVPVLAGRHRVRMRHGPHEATMLADAAEGRLTRVHLAPKAPVAAAKGNDGPRIAVTAALGGLAVAGLAAAAGLKVHESSLAARQGVLQEGFGPSACASAADARCDELARVTDQRQQADVLAGVAVGVSVAAAAGAVASFLWLGPRAPRDSAAAPPRLLVGFGSAQLRGTF